MNPGHPLGELGCELSPAEMNVLQMCSSTFALLCAVDCYVELLQ
jgi:hypothetical protein